MSWQKPLKDYCIYALKCPDTDVIKYIGLTTNGITRLYGHWRDFKPNKSGKVIRVKAWVRKLKSEGKKFTVQYLDYADSIDELTQKEIYWIKFYRDMGLDLLNHADGGFIPTIKSYTNAEKLEISRKTKLAMARPEVRARFLAGQKNKVIPKKYKPRSEETKKIHANSDYILKKKIKVQDSNGVIYESIMDAAKKIGVSWTAVARHLKGLQKTVKGLKLVKYVE